METTNRNRGLIREQPTTRCLDMFDYKTSDMTNLNRSGCHITEHSVANNCPDGLPDCRAISYGGVDPINVAYKLEETDMNFEHSDDYVASLEYSKDDFMRNALTDRNCDIPFAEGDTPAYSATKRGGLLNLRYNGGRGTTDYQPEHAEMMIGQDPYAGSDTGLKMAELKKFTAQRAQDAEVRMGNNCDQEIPEQPWADPEISYAKKDLMVQGKHRLNIWQWPQFLNINVASKTEVDPIGEKQTRFDCAQHEVDAIDVDAAYDTEGKRRKTQVGYDYSLSKYQEYTMDFQEGKEGQQRSTKHPERVENSRNTVKAGSHNLTDHSIKAKTFKSKMLEAMKSAVETQESSGVMGNSDHSRKVKSGKERDDKSVIRDIVHGHKTNKEVMTTVKGGILPSEDYGFASRHTQAPMRSTLQIKTNMIKGARNDGDQTFIKRNIENSMRLNKEEKAKLCASSLRDNVDRGAIMREIAHQHKTGCSEKTKCYGDKKAGRYLEESRKDDTAPTAKFTDDHYTHVRKSKHLEVDPRSIKDYANMTDDTFDNNISDTCKHNSRNR
uniref:Uncharacterized protein n=1 Tax=viral metagenome TaxID=1070528 RepID=A0A6C0LI75_9ZZZZ